MKMPTNNDLIQYAVLLTIFILALELYRLS